MNNVRYLKAKFGAWASITRKIKARNVLMVRVKVPRTKKIEQNCFSKWKADFEMENKAKKAGIHKEIYVKKAFFNFTKKEVSRNKLLIKLFESARRDHNYMRMILEQVKINANERKEARELKKWGRSGS
jgi:dihydropteroate synthase